MTATTLAPRPVRPPRQRPTPGPRRWFGVLFALLLGLAAVCHGCHFGDHDDELSLQAGPKIQRNDDARQKPPPATMNAER